MARCSVLRCPQLAHHIFAVNKPGGLDIETWVCDEHYDRLLAGASWDWNFGHGEVLMGSDVTPRLVNVTVEETADRTELGESFNVELELGRDGETLDLVRFRITPQQARDLADSVTIFLPPNP